MGRISEAGWLPIRPPLAGKRQRTTDSDRPVAASRSYRSGRSRLVPERPRAAVRHRSGKPPFDAGIDPCGPSRAQRSERSRTSLNGHPGRSLPIERSSHFDRTRVGCSRGHGTRVAGLCVKSSGDVTRHVVPSRHGVFKCNATRRQVEGRVDALQRAEPIRGDKSPGSLRAPGADKLLSFARPMAKPERKAPAMWGGGEERT